MLTVKQACLCTPCVLLLPTSRSIWIERLVRSVSDRGAYGRIYSGRTCGCYGGPCCHEVDIVLTTPEYLAFHAADFAATGSIGFAVIDEAHHVGTSKAGFRPFYARLGESIAALGSPQVLAVTATANSEVEQCIREAFLISPECVVVDEHERTNLAVVDQRNMKKRERYLVNLVAQGEKTLIYC